MNCLECQDDLQRRLDGGHGGDDKGLEQHLAACASCRETHAAALRLQQGLRQLRRLVPPADLGTRIAAAVLKDRAHRRGRMTRRLYLTAALAASVFVMLLLSYSLHNRTEPTGVRGPYVAQPKPHVPQPPADKSGDERQARSDSLVERTRDQLNVLIPAIIDPDVRVDELPSVAELESLDPAAQSLKQAGREVTASLQSVTRSARQAFDYFTRELPVPDVGTRE
jgi:hypothetical protein